MKQKRHQEERGPVELADEAFHLLRRVPASAVAAYCLGTLPFVLGLLYFWSDMARSAFASDRLLMGTFAMSLLFLWMKTWQAVFARQLLAQLCGEPPPGIKPAWLLRTMIHQAIVQPLGLFLLPISVVLLFPTGWVYGFFTNATLFSGTADDVRTVIRKSWRQATLWTMQSHYVVFLFKLFGLFVFLNVMSAVVAVPLALKTLLGIETVFSRSSWAILNTTVLAGVACLTFLCIDPVLKAIYVLRCFHGESLATGQDLKADLSGFTTPRRIGAVAALVFSLILLPATFGAEEIERRAPKPPPALSTPTLDRTIDDVLQQREYSWRLPRDGESVQSKSAQDDNLVTRFFKSVESGLKEIHRWIRDFADWISRRSDRPGTPSTDGLSLAGAIRGLIYLLLIALALWIAWLLFRLWKRGGPSTEIAAQAVQARPNIADENVGADQLPEDGWMAMARDLLGRGELRLALRAFYLATLAHLAERNLITLARFKSNRDYEQELSRRGHALADLPELFSQNVTTFERVWYGPHGVTPEMLDEFARNTEKLKGQT